jgi:CheY-like chemotaxis protein
MARILIVDDEESDRLFERSILEQAGHELLFASDGEHALRVFREHPVDVVVTDLAMPHLNGLQLIRSLLEEDEHARIIAVSGVSPEQLPTAEDLGAERTLFKPVDPGKLLRTVDELLDEDDDPWGP